MNLDELHRKLIAAARVSAPDDRVPYAFERRIMARLEGRRVPDLAALWARGLWRAAAACVGVMVLLSALSLFLPSARPVTNDFSQELENTVLAAAADQDQPASDIQR